MIHDILKTGSDCFSVLLCDHNFLWLHCIISRSMNFICFQNSSSQFWYPFQNSQYNQFETFTIFLFTVRKINPSATTENALSISRGNLLQTKHVDVSTKQHSVVYSSHHHILITFYECQVVFFYFFLGPFNALGDHAMLYHFAFFITKLIHDLGNTFATKHTHQVIF